MHLQLLTDTWSWLETELDLGSIVWSPIFHMLWTSLTYSSLVAILPRFEFNIQNCIQQNTRTPCNESVDPQTQWQVLSTANLLKVYTDFMSGSEEYSLLFSHKLGNPVLSQRKINSIHLKCIRGSQMGRCISFFLSTWNRSWSTVMSVCSRAISDREIRQDCRAEQSSGAALSFQIFQVSISLVHFIMFT